MNKSELVQLLERKRDEDARAEHIYEPKYGGKDHSGYDTMMKYEINYEREEAFERGFNAALELLMPVALAVEEFNLKFSPGDNWFPEMRDALAELKARLEKETGK